MGISGLLPYVSRACCKVCAVTVLRSVLQLNHPLSSITGTRQRIPWEDGCNRCGLPPAQKHVLQSQERQAHPLHLRGLCSQVRGALPCHRLPCGASVRREASASQEGESW